MVQYLEDALLLQRTSVWFPVTTSDGSQMPVTPDPGNPINTFFWLPRAFALI